MPPINCGCANVADEFVVPSVTVAAGPNVTVLLPSAEITLPLPSVNVILSNTPVWLIRSPELVPKVNAVPDANVVGVAPLACRVRATPEADRSTTPRPTATPLSVPPQLVGCKTPPLAVRLPPVIVPPANCKLPVNASKLLAPALLTYPINLTTLVPLRVIVPIAAVVNEPPRFSVPLVTWNVPRLLQPVLLTLIVEPL